MSTTDKPVLTVIDGGKADSTNLTEWVAEFAARIDPNAPVLLLGVDKESKRFVMKHRAHDEAEVLSTLALGCAATALHLMPTAAVTADVEE